MRKNWKKLSKDYLVFKFVDQVKFVDLWMISLISTRIIILFVKLNYLYMNVNFLNLLQGRVFFL